MEYWINSNSGDYVSLDKNGKYKLNLISRYSDGKYLPHESIELTISQFSQLKGFIPIKQKKLFNNRQKKVYAPTNSDGKKGESKRINALSVSEVRDSILKELGL